MNCNEYLPLLSGHLDGANSAAEEARLQKHLASCKQCCALLGQLEQNDAMLLSSKAEPPSELTSRIMAQVQQEQRRKQSLRRTFWSIGAAGFAAAALLAFVFFGDLKLPSLEQDTGIPTVMVYADAENEAITADGLSEDMALQFAYEGFAAEQESDLYGGVYDISRSPVQEADEGTLKTAANDEANIAAIPPSEFLLQLPSPYSDTVNDAPERVAGISTPHRSPNTRTQAATASPLLVIWGTQTEELSLLYDLTPSDDATAAPSDDAGDSLYARLLSALPLAKKLSETAPQQASALTVTEYSVSYECFSALFHDCAGVYETAVYYPADLTAFENCTVLMISYTAD